MRRALKTSKVFSVYAAVWMIACASAKSRLGLDYEVHESGRREAAKKHEIGRRSIFCAPSGHDPWANGWKGQFPSMSCWALIEAEPEEVIAIVGNPYFSDAVDSPFFPQVFAGSARAENTPRGNKVVRFRYHARADTSESAWSYLILGESGYRGYLETYTGTGMLLRSSGHWENDQPDRAVWRLFGGGALPDVWPNGVLTTEVSFFCGSMRVCGSALCASAN